jgi:uncharacterized coiled-coil protein SlyX
MDPTIEARLTKLEETLAFQEHTLEQLDEEVRRGHLEMERLRRELSRLEQRLIDSREPDIPSDNEESDI